MRIATKGGRILRKNGRLCTSCCGGTGVPCVTCPGRTWPTTLHGIFSTSVPGCCNLDGLAVPFTWDGTSLFLSPLYSGLCCADSGFDQRGWVISCWNATTLLFSYEDNIDFGHLTGPCCRMFPIGSTAIFSTSVICSPFQAVFTGSLTAVLFAPFPCPCAGATWTLTVTD